MSAAPDRDETARRLLGLLAREARILDGMLLRLAGVEAGIAGLDSGACRDAASSLAGDLADLVRLEEERIALTGAGAASFADVVHGSPPSLADPLRRAREDLMRQRQALREAVARHGRAASHLAAFARTMTEELRRRATLPGYSPGGRDAGGGESGRLYRSAL
ncbi:hypothetical protein L6R50_13675 [Myxococcota bacterium]|nr:hypothetical protein [Myxococcota bacterium]